MTDVSVHDGADAVFTCEVCGRPPPEITWSGPGHVTASSHGSADGRVTIKRCEVTGLVTLEVRRHLGRDRFSKIKTNFSDLIGQI